VKGEGVKTSSDPSYIFSGVKTPKLPGSTPLFTDTRLNRSFNGANGMEKNAQRDANTARWL